MLKFDEKILNDYWGQLYAALLKKFYDFQLVEDALQEAFIRLSETIDEDESPKDLKAWLYRVSQNIILDKIRRAANFSSKLEDVKKTFLLNQRIYLSEDEAFIDERLRLIFTCCHPAISFKSQVILTLRVICGLSIEQIAKAFLSNKSNIEQMLTRAKRKIKVANIPYEIPNVDIIDERTGAVLNVIYLIYNEGFSTNASNKLSDDSICQFALDLAKMLYKLIEAKHDSGGLLALLFFLESRRKTQLNFQGEFLTLEDQDRSKWDADKIKKAKVILKDTLIKGGGGQYSLQAAISALHTEAKSFEQTDWKQIYLLYLELIKLNDSTVLRLNSLVAYSYVVGVSVRDCLDKMDHLQKELKNYQPYYAAKAQMYERIQELEKASKYYEKAINLSCNDVQKNYLLKKLKFCSK